jgi:hypothetical protein
MRLVPLYNISREIKSPASLLLAESTRGAGCYLVSVSLGIDIIVILL